MSEAPESSSTGLDSRTASGLCYAAWWMTGLLFLFLERSDRQVRTHAAQSVVVFGLVSLLLLLLSVVSAMTLVMAPTMFRATWSVNTLFWLGGVVLWLVLMVLAFRGNPARVPLVAPLVERLAR